MKRQGRPSVHFTGSRNSNYYVKRVRINDGKGTQSIKNFFKQVVDVTPISHISDSSECFLNDENAISSAATSDLVSSVGPTATADSISQPVDSFKESITTVQTVSDIGSTSNEYFPSTSNTEYVEISNFSSTHYLVDLVSSVGPSASVNSISQPVSFKESITSVSNVGSTSSVSNVGSTSSVSNVGSISSVECFPTISHQQHEGFPKNIFAYEKSFPWIYYSPSAGGYLCKICSIKFKDGPWADKGINFHGHPTRCIHKHENSSKHQKALASSKSLQNLSVIEKIQKGQKNAEEEKRDTNRKLLIKFVKVLYFMIKKHWAVTENFESMIRFMGNELGDPEIHAHLRTCANNATYMSHVSVSNLMQAISVYLEEKTVTALKCADGYALLADESTDEAQREQLGLIVRYKIAGVAEIKEEYLGIINLKSTNAESIMTAIEKFFIAKDIELSRCLFIALDGANVMSGETSGVQRRMKLHSPHSIYVNCRNHRLALVFVHLLKKYDNLQSVDSLLVSLWKIFHYSPAKSHVFKDIQGDVYDIKILKMLKVSVTRWLSHGHACKRVISRYIPLVEALDALFIKTKEPEIKGITEQLLHPEVLLTLLFLSDFLDKVERLNLWLQSPSIAFSSVFNQVNKLVAEVNSLVCNLEKGQHFRKCNELIAFAQDCTELSIRLRSSIKTYDCASLIETFKKKFVEPFMKDFQFEINRAFLISDSCAPLNGFDVFSGRNISTHNYDESTSKKAEDSVSRDSLWQILLSFYGKEKMHKFQGAKNISTPAIDAAAAELEIPGFEKEICSAKLTFEMEKMKRAQKFIHQDKQEQAKKTMAEIMQPTDLMNILEGLNIWPLYPNLMKLLSFSLIIPSSTASVERLFSKMNLVCTDLRSRMTQQSLDMHLRIIVNGPDRLLDIEYREIVTKFKNAGNRRLLL